MALSRVYDTELIIDADYKATLPDLQNGDASLIQGAPVAIPQVGIHHFRLPLKFVYENGETILLETSITGTVSLDAHAKGINMSRIMRTFYKYRDQLFTPRTLRDILDSYRVEVGSLEARLTLKFRYPIENQSLRSGLSGIQYYDVVLESRLNRKDVFTELMHLDFVYSSACPCSYELAQHAINNRQVAAIPHSQRSVARISIDYTEPVSVRDLRDICLEALKTETQVVVKREDEQAFAELNGAHQKFVEDAVRLLYAELSKDKRIRDFKVIASHQESLHSHDAIAVITKGIENGFQPEVDPHLFASLIHRP